MKKLFFLSALAALALCFTACGDDNNNDLDPVNLPKIEGKDLLNITVTKATNSVNHVDAADYTFSLKADKNDTYVSIVAGGVNFDPRMPVEVSFRMEDIKIGTKGSNYVQFSAPSVKYYDITTGEENTRYKITNVKGYIADFSPECYALEYTINDTWRVLVCSNTLVTKVNNNDYSNLYYQYAIDANNMKAEVFIYNVQFEVGGAMSPTLKKISVPSLDIAATPTGLELTGDGIVPIHYSGTGLDVATPYPALTVTNFSATLNLTNGAHSIFFNCHDGEHSNKSPLWLWN